MSITQNLIAGAAGSLLTLAIITTLGAGPRAEQAEVLKVRGLDVVDAAGTTRIRLKATDTVATVAILDAKGEMRVGLSHLGEESSLLFGRTNDRRVAILAGEKSAKFYLGAGNKDAGVLATATDAAASVVVRESDKRFTGLDCRPTANGILAQSGEASFGAGFQTKGGRTENRIVIINDKGEVQWSEPKSAP